MSINGISGYTLINALYGLDSDSSSQANPLLEPEKSSSAKTGLYSCLTLSDSTSGSLLDDSVDLSATAEFFSQLKQLREEDPDTFEKVFQRIGETLKNARGSEQQVFSVMAGYVSGGGDIADLAGGDSCLAAIYSQQGAAASSTTYSASDLSKLISSILAELEGSGTSDS